MRTFAHSFVVASSIDSVWDFYTDMHHLEVITPKHMELRILEARNQKLQQNDEVKISGRLLIRRTWKSKITYITPYEYTDEMITGPFKLWRHVHNFRKLDDNHTEVNDTIEFELPYGFLGKLFEGYAEGRLRQVFAHRKAATRQALES